MFNQATLFYNEFASVIYKNRKGVINKKGELVSFYDENDDWLTINTPLTTFNFTDEYEHITKGAYYSWDLTNLLTGNVIISYFKEVKKGYPSYPHTIKPFIHRNYIVVFGKYVFDFKGRLVNYLDNTFSDKEISNEEFIFKKSFADEILYTSVQGKEHIVRKLFLDEVVNDSILLVQRISGTKSLYNINQNQQVKNSENIEYWNGNFFYKNSKEITEGSIHPKDLVEMFEFIRNPPKRFFEYDFYAFTGQALTKVNKASRINDNFYLIEYNGKYGFINNRFFVKPVYADIACIFNYYLIKHRNHWALYDENFEPLTDFIYEDYNINKYDVKLFAGDKFHYLRKDEKFNDKFYTYANDVSWFSSNDTTTDSLFLIYNEKLYGFEDSNRNVKLPTQFSFIYQHDNGLYTVKFKEKYGVINAQGKYVISPKYSRIISVGSSHFLLEFNDNQYYSLVDSTYDEIARFKNVEFNDIRNDRIILKNIKDQPLKKVFYNIKSHERITLNERDLQDETIDRVDVIFDKDGKYRYTKHITYNNNIKQDFQDSETSVHTYALNDNKYIDITTKKYIQWSKFAFTKFKGITKDGSLKLSFDDRRSTIKILNKEGEEVFIEGCKILSVSKEGVFICEAKKGKIGLYNYFDQKWILPCEYDFIEKYEYTGYLLTHKDNQFQLLEFNGEVIPFELTPNRI